MDWDPIYNPKEKRLLQGAKNDEQTIWHHIHTWCFKTYILQSSSVIFSMYICLNDQQIIYHACNPHIEICFTTTFY